MPESLESRKALKVRGGTRTPSAMWIVFKTKGLWICLIPKEMTFFAMTKSLQQVEINEVAIGDRRVRIGVKPEGRRTR